MKKIHLFCFCIVCLTHTVLAQTEVTLYVKESCPDCEQAIQKLYRKGYSFKVQHIAGSDAKAEMLKKIGKDPGFYPVALYETKDSYGSNSGWYAGYNAADKIIEKLGSTVSTLNNSGNTTNSNSSTPPGRINNNTNTTTNSNTTTNTNNNTTNPTPGVKPSGVAQEMLKEHNQWRAELGIAPLKWSNELASYAQEWANELGKKGCDLEHRPSSGKFTQKYGENIYMGYEGYHATPKHAVDAWADEKQYFNFETMEWDWQECGHYTQIIWEESTEVGCASFKCADGKVVWICNYNPPGNFVGEPPFTKK